MHGMLCKFNDHDFNHRKCYFKKGYEYQAELPQEQKTVEKYILIIIIVLTDILLTEQTGKYDYLNICLNKKLVISLYM